VRRIDRAAAADTVTRRIPQTRKSSVLKSMLLAGLAAFAITSPALAAPNPALHDQALDLLKRGIGFRTVIPGDQVRPYADELKRVLVGAGFAPEDVEVRPMAGTAVLIARYRGADPKLKPILVIDHMDVVEAKRADWTRDPFTAVVENGYVFGRGAVDDKFDVSMVVTVLSQLKREGWRPGRDVILALSGDEETVQATARAMAVEFKNAELVLNGDAGGGELSPDGQALSYGIQAAEKSYADFQITVTNPGGHSSRPGKINAIYQLAADLGRLAAYRFPVMTNEITLGAFRAAAPTQPGSTGEALRRFLANPKDEAAIEAYAAEARKEMLERILTGQLGVRASSGPRVTGIEALKRAIGTKWLKEAIAKYNAKTGKNVALPTGDKVINYMGKDMTRDEMIAAYVRANQTRVDAEAERQQAAEAEGADVGDEAFRRHRPAPPPVVRVQVQHHLHPTAAHTS
jgi:acetylornithine deacetylase/succinyl-diaminopimelate desuccinylase-like protein